MFNSILKFTMLGLDQKKSFEDNDRPKSEKVLTDLSPTKTEVNSIIDEIHESFYTEVDKLLEEAKIKKSINREVLEKNERLKNLGFSRTQHSESAREEELAENQNKKKESLIRAIDYFSTKYPQYKFITEDSVKRICQKYNLIYGEVGKYKGEVPDKNLAEIEKFKIKDEDRCYGYTVLSHSFGEGSLNLIDRIINHKEFRELKNDIEVSPNHRYYTRTNELPLEIAAPIKDFDTRGMELKDYKLSKIEIPDPVVLHPVFFEGRKHYLIVTAWGQESEDELVINQKMN